MKNVLSLILLAAMLTCSVAIPASAAPRLRGDANGDGKINARDAYAMMRIAVGLDEGGDLADWNKDGAINARDVTSLMRCLVGYYEANDELLEYSYGVSAPDFEIADPVTESTVSGADFGFDTAADDNCDAFKSAAAYLAANPGTTLKLEKGTYRMGKEYVYFNGVKNCVIDGGGSKLLYNDRNYFRVDGCENFKFCNFSIDWDASNYHIASLVRIKSVDKQHVVEFEFPEETDASYAVDIDWGVMFNLDPEDLAPGVHGKGDWVVSEGAEYIKNRSLTAPNVITAYVPDLPLEVGEMYLLRHFQYGAEAFGVERSSGVVFEDVDIHTGPSSGYYIQGYTHHVRFTRVHIEPNPDEFDRFPISTTADAFAIRDTQGYIIIEDCSVGYCYDDIMNIHDNVAYVDEVTAPDKIVIHAMNTSAFQLGDTITFRRKEDFTPIDVTAKVIGIRWLPDNLREFTLDREVESAGVEYGTIVHDKTTDTAHIIIRDSYFHQGRSRMILGCSDTVFEQNRVYKTQLEPILIACGIGVGTWANAEGEGVDDLIIRNNVFDSCNVKGQKQGAVIAFEATYDMNPSGRLLGEVFTNILIANNRFADVSGCIVQAANVRNLTVYANTTLATREPYADVLRSAMGKIKITGKYSADSRILGNMWLASEYFHSLIWEPTVASGGSVEVDGNRIIG